MQNPEALRKLLHSMNTFCTAYHALLSEIGDYEAATNTDINNLPGFNEFYPFDASLDELYIDRWVENIVDHARKNSFKVLNYEYLNTGGNCMVGIFTVWLPALKQTVYVFTNDIGCAISTVDYISNDIEIDDYDEVTIDRCDFDDLCAAVTHFELYRYCLNEYTKSDCSYFGSTYAWPYHLLSDELQSEVHHEYLEWCKENNNGCIPTDGHKIIVHPDFDTLFYDPHDDSKNSTRTEVYTSYIPTEDTTVVWQDLIVNDECIQRSLVGFYYGEPDEKATHDFSNMPLTAQFL